MPNYNISKLAPKAKLHHYKGKRITTDAIRYHSYARGGFVWEWWYQVRGLGKFRTLKEAKAAIDRRG